MQSLEVQKNKMPNKSVYRRTESDKNLISFLCGADAGNSMAGRTNKSEYLDQHKSVDCGMEKNDLPNQIEKRKENIPDNGREVTPYKKPKNDKEETKVVDANPSNKSEMTEMERKEAKHLADFKICFLSDQLSGALHQNIGQTWFEALEQEFRKPYFDVLNQFLQMVICLCSQQGADFHIVGTPFEPVPL